MELTASNTYCSLCMSGTASAATATLTYQAKVLDANTITGGEMADLVLDCAAGGPQTIVTAVNLARKSGRANIMSPSSTTAAAYPPAAIGIAPGVATTMAGRLSMVRTICAPDELRTGTPGNARPSSSAAQPTSATNSARRMRSRSRPSNVRSRGGAPPTTCGGSRRPGSRTSRRAGAGVQWSTRVRSTWTSIRCEERLCALRCDCGDSAPSVPPGGSSRRRA